MINDLHVTVDELAERLRAWAQGSYATEAAVELLITHESWLHRKDFLEAVWIGDEFAGVDWERVRTATAASGASSSERRILDLVLGLAGEPSDQSLSSLITGLDATNVTLVVNAFAHCAGWADRGLTVTVNGAIDSAPHARSTDTVEETPHDRHHLHHGDYPDTLALLAELLTGRGRRTAEVAQIGYEPTEDGAWVDWAALGHSWLSSTEKAIIHIARGCAVLERAGGLPAHRAGPVIATVTAVSK